MKSYPQTDETSSEMKKKKEKKKPKKKTHDFTEYIPRSYDLYVKIHERLPVQFCFTHLICEWEFQEVSSKYTAALISKKNCAC